MSSPLFCEENSPTLNRSNGVGSVVEPFGFQNDARVPSFSDKKLLIIILANVYGGGDVDIHFVWVPAQSLMVEEDVVVHFVWIIPAQVLIEAVYLMELMEANSLLSSMEEMRNSVRELQETAEALKKQLEELRMQAIELRREQKRLTNSIFVMMFIITVMLVLLIKKFMSLF